MSKTKSFLAALICVLCLCACMLLAACGGAGGKADGPTIGVDMTIEATAVDQGEFYSGHLTLPEGSTVYDALEASKVVFDGSKKYVKSINGLAEKQYGGTSGWTFTVNGEMVMKGAGKCELVDGDVVIWSYVTGEPEM